MLINGGTGFNEQNRVPEAVGVLFERTVQALARCSASSLPKSRALPCRAALAGWPIAP